MSTATSESFLDRFSTADKLFIGSIVMVLVSGFLPLMTADTAIIDVNGSLESSMDGTQAPDWYLLLGASVIAGLVVAFRKWDWITMVVAGLCGVFVAGLALAYVNNPTMGAEYTGPGEPSISAGSGMYLLLAAGAIQLVSVYFGYKEPTPDAAAPESPAPGPTNRQRRDGQQPRRSYQQPRRGGQPRREQPRQQGQRSQRQRPQSGQRGQQPRQRGQQPGQRGQQPRQRGQQPRQREQQQPRRQDEQRRQPEPQRRRQDEQRRQPEQRSSEGPGGQDRPDSASESWDQPENGEKEADDSPDERDT